VSTMDDWQDVVLLELGLSGPVDRDIVLDLTRDVAHNVARPAAPLTAFLVGLAAGRSDDPAGTAREMAARIAELARGWAGTDADRVG